VDATPIEIRWLLLAVAGVLVVSGAAFGGEIGEAVAPVTAALGVGVAFVATRPWHPIVAPLYRRRLEGAWTDWAEAVERWQARGDAKGAAEAQLATEQLVERLHGLRPPPAERERHTRRIAQVTAYAEALHAWRQAPAHPTVAARLQAAHDALG